MKIFNAILIFIFLLALAGSYLGVVKYREISIQGQNNNFLELISEKGELVKVNKSIQNDVLSPLKITGEVRGSWSFEATFPVILTNWDGLIIGESYATIEGDWMTSNFVPFKADIAFSKPDFDSRGYLILKKSNPSGLPGSEDSVEIPINFK
jgi:hypothetical protein